MLVVLLPRTSYPDLRHDSVPEHDENHGRQELGDELAHHLASEQISHGESEL